MIRALLRVASIGAWLCLVGAAGAVAEPIKLKLSYFSSDRTILYQSGVKPFVDAVNAEAEGLLEVQVFFSGTLGKYPEVAQLVREGVADIGYIAPGYTEEKFPDNSVLEMPGLFRDQREASLVYTRMIAANALRGYEDFVVIAAITSEPQSIHSRKPIASLADLKGLIVRGNNPIEAQTFEKLGMKSTIIPVNQIAGALASGTIDGAAIPPAMLGEFGVGRIANYHYMLHGIAVPLALVMNRQKFNSLPPLAQEIIRKYSGEWAAARSNEFFEDLTAKTMAQLQSDPKRKVIYPSAGDRSLMHDAFKQIIDDWIAKSPRNRELMSLAEAEIAKLRSGQ